MDLKVLKCNNADHQPSQELQEYIINNIIKKHEEMDPPDRRQVWEAPSPTRSNAGYLTPPTSFFFSPPTGSQGVTSGDWKTN